MTKRQKPGPPSPHTRPYEIALWIVVGAALLGLLAFAIMLESERAPEQTLWLMVAGLFFLVNYGSERALRRPLFGRTISEIWQKRLTFGITAGFLTSAIVTEGTTGAWAIISQFTGGWVIFTAIWLWIDLTWNRVKKRFKSKQP